MKNLTPLEVGEVAPDIRLKGPGREFARLTQHGGRAGFVGDGKGRVADRGVSANPGDVGQIPEIECSIRALQALP